MLLLGALLACADAPNEGSERAPALVRVATVEAGVLTEPWTTLAEVQALDDAQLAVGADGPVARVLVREGDAVQKGDLLLQLDTRLAAADHRRAVATADAAAAELRRLRAVLERREGIQETLLADEELDRAREEHAAAAARFAAAEAEAARALAILGRHRITAPFDGVITTRDADLGDWVRAGTPLLSVLSTSSLEVRAQVPRSIAARLSPGAAVRLDDDEGTVNAVLPALDPTSRTALVRIAPAPAAALRPGQAVRLTVPLEWRDASAVKVHRDAVIADPEQASVVEVVDGKARPTPVELLATTATEALVRSPSLAPGDQVIVRGNERVQPDAPVRVESGEALADGTQP